MVPLLLLGHLFNLLPPTAEQVLVSLWAILFLSVCPCARHSSRWFPTLEISQYFEYLKRGQQPSSASFDHVIR